MSNNLGLGQDGGDPANKRAPMTGGVNFQGGPTKGGKATSKGLKVENGLNPHADNTIEQNLKGLDLPGLMKEATRQAREASATLEEKNKEMQNFLSEQIKQQKDEIKEQKNEIQKQKDENGKLTQKVRDLESEKKELETNWRLEMLEEQLKKAKEQNIPNIPIFVPEAAAPKEPDKKRVEDLENRNQELEGLKLQAESKLTEKDELYKRTARDLETRNMQLQAAEQRYAESKSRLETRFYDTDERIRNIRDEQEKSRSAILKEMEAKHEQEKKEIWMIADALKMLLNWRIEDLEEETLYLNSKLSGTDFYGFTTRAKTHSVVDTKLPCQRCYTFLDTMRVLCKTGTAGSARNSVDKDKQDLVALTANASPTGRSRVSENMAVGHGLSQFPGDPPAAPLLDECGDYEVDSAYGSLSSAESTCPDCRGRWSWTYAPGT